MFDGWYLWAPVALLLFFIFRPRKKKDPLVYPSEYTVIVNHAPWIKRNGTLRLVMFAPEEGNSVIIVGRAQGLEELISTGAAQKYSGNALLAPVAALDLIEREGSYEVKPACNGLGIENTSHMMQHFLEHTSKRINFQALF
jgi:hypothetical protein